MTPGEAVGHSTLLRDAVVYLTAAVVLVPLFHKLKLGAVLGYLAAGILIGPGVLALVSEAESTMAFAEFGIVLLLFVVGLELRPARLWRLRHDIFGLGLLQVVVTGALLTVVVHTLTSLSWAAALVVGLPLSLSSTALVVQLLQERQALGTRFGERSFSVLLFQDLAIVPLLTLVAALSRVPDPTARPGWEEGLLTLAAVAGLALAGFALRPIFRAIGMIGAREAFVAAALLTVLGAAYLMQSLGLSMALGAFVAGVMLAESPYRHQLEADIEPFRGLLLGLFFISVGMSLDTRVVSDNIGLIALLVVAVMSVKAVAIAGLAKLFGAPTGSAFRTGLLLAQGGEFGFVLFASAQRGLLIAPEAANLFSAVVTISMLLTPFIVRLAARTSTVAPKTDHLATPDKAAPAPVIIVGYGRFGQGVDQMLGARGIKTVLIDFSPRQVELALPFRSAVYYGDGRRLDVLRAAGAENAKLIAFCTDDRSIGQDTFDAIRTAFPNAEIICRAFDRLHWMNLRQAGIDVVVRELFDSAIRMGGEALRILGDNDDTIDRVAEEYRRRDTERLAAQLSTGDLMAGRETRFEETGPMAGDAFGEIPFIETEDVK